MAAVVSAPLLVKSWKELCRDRLVQAAALFVATQWLAACLAPEFHMNAFKAALRFTAGLVLLMIVRTTSDLKLFSRVWVIVSGVAAIYALGAYAGFGVSSLFREQEFFIGAVQRLSGSFEYPNTAAAYFGMSLAIVWWSSFRRVWKWIFAVLLWSAITLTFSKGAFLAVMLVVLAVLAFAKWSRSKVVAWQECAALIGLGIVTYAALLPTAPYLSARVYGSGKESRMSAVYMTPWNTLQQQPGVDDAVSLQIRNSGPTKWRSQGMSRAAVAYRWWDTHTGRFVKGKPPRVTALPRDVDSGETVEVQVVFRTPDLPGRYVLVLQLFTRDYHWFSDIGVPPMLLEADIRPLVSRTTGQTDMSAFYNKGKTSALPGPVGESLNASVTRLSLWRAALEMFVAHPLGVGPDNYRLQYGKYLGAANWNTQIYSNNLYLELLTGSGLIGLGAFAFMILSIERRIDAACLALAVFLIHGLVDVFLMTTPIYFAFWILLGMRASPHDRHLRV
jgi:O-antigen ligase